jgi:hypothetical protein
MAALITDDLIEGRASKMQFRRAVVSLVGNRLTGMLAARVTLIGRCLGHMIKWEVTPCGRAVATIISAVPSLLL